MLTHAYATRVVCAPCVRASLHSSRILVASQVTCRTRCATACSHTRPHLRAASARFTAPPNVGPGRSAEQEETNPYKSWSHLSHKWLLLTCAGCLCAGLLAGQMVEVDESKLRPKFRKEEVVAAAMKQFEFRPDLAASSIRLAFVLAARRAGVQASSISESCSVADGLHDLAGVVNYLANTFHASVEDITSLLAIAAVQFLGGPYDKVYESWLWGRNDDEVPARPRRRTAQGSVTGQTRPVSSTNATAHTTQTSSSSRSSSNSTETKKGAGSKPADLQTEQENDIFTLPCMSALHALGDLSVEECVALMACHSVGEFHEAVSGLERASHIGTSYRLSNAYYKFLLAHEHELVPYRVERTEENKQVAELPDNLCCTYVLAATKGGEGDEKRQTKKKRLCVFSTNEVNALLKNAVLRGVVTQFAQQDEVWREAFQSAFTRMINSNFKRLRVYSDDAN